MCKFWLIPGWAFSELFTGILKLVDNITFGAVTPFFQIVYQTHFHLTKCFLVFKKVWKDSEEGGTNSVEVGKVKTMEDMEKNIFQTIEQSLAKEAATKKPDVN